MPVFRVNLVTVDHVVFRVTRTVEASSVEDVMDAYDENDENRDLLGETVKWKETSYSTDGEDIDSIEECQEKPEFRLNADGVLVKVEKETQ